MRSITIELAGGPRGKGRPRFSTKTGRAFTPEKTVRYESELKMAAQIVMDGAPLFEGPLIVEMWAYVPIPASKSKKWQASANADTILPTTKPDPDNIAKMMDALNLVVWKDDAQITDLIVHKRYSFKPKLQIFVQTVDSEKKSTSSIFD